MVHVVNAGISGNNTRQGIARLPELLATRCDHVVLFFGMNDAMNSANLVDRDEYGANLSAMIEMARRADVRSVAVMSIHPVNEPYVAARHPTHPRRDSLQECLASYSNRAVSIARDRQALLVDWRSRFIEASPGESLDDAVASHRDSLLQCEANGGGPDGVHLVARGYRVLGEQVARVLRDRVEDGDVVVCVGDSLTFGVNVEGAGTASGQTYPAVLRARLGR